MEHQHQQLRRKPEPTTPTSTLSSPTITTPLLLFPSGSPDFEPLGKTSTATIVSLALSSPADYPSSLDSDYCFKAILPPDSLHDIPPRHHRRTPPSPSLSTPPHYGRPASPTKMMTMTVTRSAFHRRLCHDNNDHPLIVPSRPRPPRPVLVVPTGRRSRSPVGLVSITPDNDDDDDHNNNDPSEPAGQYSFYDYDSDSQSGDNNDPLGSYNLVAKPLLHPFPVRLRHRRNHHNIIINSQRPCSSVVGSLNDANDDFVNSIAVKQEEEDDKNDFTSRLPQVGSPFLPPVRRCSSDSRLFHDTYHPLEECDHWVQLIEDEDQYPITTTMTSTPLQQQHSSDCVPMEIDESWSD